MRRSRSLCPLEPLSKSRQSLLLHSSKIIDVAEAVSDTRLDDVLNNLRKIIDPDSGSDIVGLGFIQDIKISESGDLKFTMSLPSSYSSIVDDVKEQCIKELRQLSWMGEIQISFSYSKPQEIISDVARPAGMSGVRNIIAVSSCKGGVGKSTVAVNLAYTLKQAGATVGILDADIYGPSLPTMTKPTNLDSVFRQNQLYPLEYEGVKLMSMGFINRGAAIMRGPMVNQILNQFVSLTQWGDLDYLIVDMPPGTGDIQLTLAQIMNITAAVIVTTPQRLSFVDVVKGIDLFDTVNVPCVAVVENMAEYSAYSFTEEFYTTLGAQAASIAAAATSTSTSSDPSNAFKAVTDCIRTAVESQRTGKRLFGEGHTQRLRDMWGMDTLISLPLLTDVAVSGDTGTPYVLAYPDSVIAREMEDLAVGVVSEIERLNVEGSTQVTLSYDKMNDILSYGNNKLSAPALRRDCRCAVCVEEFTGRALLKPESVSESVRPLTMAPIGRYAMSVDWSDGHKALYPFRQITALVEKKL
eukprot:gene5846-11807_t